MRTDPRLGLPVPYEPGVGVGGNAGAASGSLRRDVREYIGIVRRRWWLIAVVCAVSLGPTWWRVKDRIPTYSAEVLLQQRQVESIGMMNPLGLAKRDFGAQAEIIRSRSVIKLVVESLGLQLKLRERQNELTRVVGQLDVGEGRRNGPYVLTREGATLSLSMAETGRPISTAGLNDPIQGIGFRLLLADPDVATQPIEFAVWNLDAAIRSLQRAIRVEPGKGGSLLRIVYSDPDRRHAAAVVNAVATSYQDYRARSAREEASRRQTVIADQLAELSDTLRLVEGLLEGYQQRQELIVDPEAEGSALFAARLATETEIRQYRFDITLLETLLEGLSSTQQSQGSMARAAALVPAGQALHARLQTLEAERSRLTASRFGFTSKDPRVEALDSLIANVRNDVRVATQQTLELTRSRLGEAESRLGQLRFKGGVLPQVNTELARYEQKVNAVNRVFDMLVNKYYEAQIAEGVEVGDITLIDAAAVPQWPDPSNTGLFLFSALLFGLIVGGAGTLVLDQMDSTVRHAGDAERATLLEVLGEIPHLRTTRNASEGTLRGKEAMRALRTNVRFAPGELRTLGITSSEPSEGKTTTAANLALSFLELGKRTLLIDADLRRPTLHKNLEVDLAPGLADVLKGQASLQEAIKRSGLVDGLHVLPAGAPVPGAPELIASDGFVRLVKELRNSWDVVVIDTPPVLAAADSVEIARAVDGLLFVVRANQTDEDKLKKAVERLRRVNAPLVGLVLNGVRKGEGNYEYDAYYYAERREDSQPPRRLVRGAGGKQPTSTGSRSARQ